MLAFLTSGSFAQLETFSASIQPVPSAAAVTVFVKTSVAATEKVSGVTVAIAIPAAVGARPPISVDNSANPYITYTLYNPVNQSIGGVVHYIYNILGDGNVISAGATVNFAANTDVPLLRINFNGDPALTSQIKIVNLPDGGSDPNPNSFFGFSLGADRVNQAAMFYSIPGVSTAINDGNGYSGTSYAQTTGSVPLPVQFLGFTASKKDNSALLNWAVENESALTKEYEILRSVNGVDFKSVGTMKPKHNGNSGNTYSFTDPNLSSIRSTGAIFYRIKQTDKDGKSVLSSIENVRLDNKGLAISVYPNPIKSYANVSLDLLQDTDVKISINDASGKQVQTIPMQLFKGLNIKKINLSALPAGSYMMNVNTGSEIKTISLVKVN